MSAIPTHVGIILDGNRRWAKAHNLPALEGHQRGVDTFINVVPLFFEAGVKFVSVYVFSTENWKRTPKEVSYLMGIFTTMAKTKLNELHRRGIRAVFVGRREGLSSRLLRAIEAAEEQTAKNTKGTVAFCLNYGGTYELVDAFKELLRANVNADSLEPKDIAAHLYHPELPALDLVVRTSGEQRLSNFMLWRAAYAELLWLDKHWPDFNKSDVKLVLQEYTKRERRHGGNSTT